MKLSIFFLYTTFAVIAKSTALGRRQRVATCYGDKGPNLNDRESRCLGTVESPTYLQRVTV